MLYIMTRIKIYCQVLLINILLFFIALNASAQYSATIPRALKENEIPVDRPGSYAIEGSTYVLLNNISSNASAIFLGKNITLDLNGYTITFAEGNYENIPNYDFEEGLAEWDFSKAPGAKIEDTKVQVFTGDRVLRLNKGEEITSEYINLPLSGRSYFAICGVAAMSMRVSVYVENEMGESVVCENNYDSSQIQGCPIENRSPRLGGGFVYAHLKDVPSGKYRVRVKAETDCIVDHIDIRPAMDVGIGIIEKTRTYAHADHLLGGIGGYSAFYDYTSDFKNSLPFDSLPVVEGEGVIIIKNGIIKSGSKGVLNWGIQSTASNVKIILDNVKIVASGISTGAVNVPHATITNCHFDIQSPFVINRHGPLAYSAVDLGKGKNSRVSYSEFYGGQGCLTFRGDSILIHDNLFVNRQTVTNHYSIMAGDNAKIFRNIFKPEIGSGIGIFHKNTEIYENEFFIEAAPPSCEYGHEDYSTNAIRLGDYGAEPGSDGGCYGNKIYNNNFYIRGKDFPDHEDYIPVATAVFYSTSGGDNYIYNNHIEITDNDPDSKNETLAFYIGGGSIGGIIEKNTIISNVPPFWVASLYGPASDMKIIQNTIERSKDVPGDFAHIRMGTWSYLAENIEFRSNNIRGEDSLIFRNTNMPHSYSVYWTLSILTKDKKDKAIEGAVIEIRNKNNEVVYTGKSAKDGYVRVELKEYSMEDFNVKKQDPYTVYTLRQKRVINLNKNTELIFVAR